MGLSLNVQVFRGGQMLAQQQFDSEVHRTIKIGRLPSAQLKLDDPKVSRIHAVIEFSGSDVSLIDMGSTGGTAVNGAKVHKVKLNHGDKVVLGDTQIVVGMGAAIASAAVPATAAVAAAVPRAAAGVGAPTLPPSAMPASAPWGQPGAVATVAARAAPAGARPAMPPGMVPGMQPRFDDGAAALEPVRRISQERLRSAAVESKPHPGLAPEEPMRPDNRVLELRLYWGEVLLNVHHYSKPKRITIGESKKTDVFLSSEGLPQEAFPLVRYLDGDYVLTFTKQMEGEVELGGQVHSLQAIQGSSMARRDDDLEGSYQVKLPAEARAIVHWGGATFALRFVAPPKAIPNDFFKSLDLNYLNILLASLFLHVAMVVTFIVYPYDTESLREDLFDQPGRFASLILEPPKETQSTKDLLKKIQETVDRKKQEVVEEEMPKENTKQLKILTKVPKNVQPQKTQEQRAAEVKQRFSKLFTGAGGGGAGSLLGGGGGGSLSGTLSNVIGTAGSGSATAGLAGLGIRGGALTGGGMGTSRGIGGIGTSGRLGGGGMAYGSGVGLGARKDVGISLETPVIMGALPKEAILKVIRQNQNQIRYCYEIQLQKQQDLEGRVKMKWVIGGTGDVVKVQVAETTMRSPPVENCIAEKIRGWKFPAPAGGGIVEVVYPWVLKAS